MEYDEECIDGQQCRVITQEMLERRVEIINNKVYKEVDKWKPKEDR